MRKNGSVFSVYTLSAPVTVQLGGERCRNKAEITDLDSKRATTKCIATALNYLFCSVPTTKSETGYV